MTARRTQQQQQQQQQQRQPARAPPWSVRGGGGGGGGGRRRPRSFWVDKWPAVIVVYSLLSTCAIVITPIDNIVVPIIIIIDNH
jgi:hypothetical protein